MAFAGEEAGAGADAPGFCANAPDLGKTTTQSEIIAKKKRHEKFRERTPKCTAIGDSE